MPAIEQALRVRPVLLFALLTSLALAGCGSGTSQHQSGCATPAPANPILPLTVDPAVRGAADVSRLTAMAFSQVEPGERDQQVLDLEPDIVIRGWQRWDRGGLTSAEYDAGYLADVHGKGIAFMGGSTASAIFRDEVASEEAFQAELSCDTRGQPVNTSTGPGLHFYRASLASPAYRQRLIDIGKLQLDLGADGLFYDEVTSSYDGARHDGNEGFDDAHVADFGGFLCDRYRGLDTAARDARLGLRPGELDCGGDAPIRGRSFDYRDHLRRNGWLDWPLSATNWA